jgi:hypothetical protein
LNEAAAAEQRGAGEPRLLIDGNYGSKSMRSRQPAFESHMAATNLIYELDKWLKIAQSKALHVGCYIAKQILISLTRL